MKTPTQKQIDAEIKTLEAYKAKVPRGTMTDNRAAIEAQLEVLKDRLSHDDIYDRWGDDERDLDTRCGALDALQWMDGEKKEKPSEGWKELVS